MRKLFSLIASLFCFSYLLAQDLEKEYNTFIDRWNKNPISVSGATGLSSTFYQTDRNTGNNIPFMYNIYGTVDFDILGIHAPLGLFYSNKNSHYNLPAYHFIGISPSYKGHTLHLGDRNMDLGQYSFSGLGFSGIGAESKLGNFQFKFMYGRIRKASLRDLETHNTLESSYRRNAWGAGIEYSKNDLILGLHLFKAWDVISSLPSPTPDSVLPRSGTILEVKTAKKIGNFSIHIDYAYNVLNKNITLESSPDKHSIFSIIPGLQDYNNASGIYNAIKTGVDCNIKSWIIGLEYERIDPGYESPGTLFYNNDLETMSSNIQMNFFKNKLNSKVRIGLQRNNLQGDQNNSFKRWVSSINLGYKMDQKTNIAINYSNFIFGQKSYLSTTPFVDVDTLILTQNNLNTGINILRQIGKLSRLSALFSYNRSEAINNKLTASNSQLANYLGTLGYIINFNEHKLCAGSSVTYSYLTHSAGTTILWGPAVNISRDVIADKWNISVNTGFFIGKTNEDKNAILRLFINNNYKVNKSFNAQLQIMYSKSKSHAIPNSNDLMINSGINYTLESTPIFKTFANKKTKSPK